MKVAVLGIEPIEPAVGGSRQRLKGVYHALGAGIDTTYVGAFHWRGPQARHLRHGPGLEEFTIPFGDPHFDAVEPLCKAIGGAGIVDASFPRLSPLSGDYCRKARAAATDADVVVFSHPWAYPVVRDVVDPGRQMVVYDAHNVEGPLLHALLDHLPGGRDLADEGEAVERELCIAADLVLACSDADARRFTSLYGVPAEGVRIVPNGVFASEIVPASADLRRAARAQLRLGRRPVALFIGEIWPPNVEAAEFIRDRLAPACPRVQFVVLGAAGSPLREAAARGVPVPRNLCVRGRVDDAEKLRWLAAADIGINPMFGGGGTNLKLVEYMSAGLPVVSTRFGARGIDDGRTCLLAETEAFAAAVSTLAINRALRHDLAARGRLLVERRFDWSNVSPEAGAVIRHRFRHKGRPAPHFSVLVATLDRSDKLRRLLDMLAMQTERDFEVVVVDQSAAPPPFDLGDFGLAGAILHTPVRGASRARNIAASVARGRIYAFTDDDCEPTERWLAEARRAFESRDIVGLEGRIYSDCYGDAAWRSVHNYGAEGVGFMTGNLFVAAQAFHAAGGFDGGFDAFQAREDTDLGWRLWALGEVPFSEAALVYHPPWSRRIPRESLAARDRMFEADALLLFKHPDRFRELFLREGHWQRGKAYWEPFLRGAKVLGLALPDYVEERRRTHGGGA